MIHGPCEYCSNPDKAKWPSQCAYVGSFPSREAFIKSTFDPPCACDAYDEGQRELVRHEMTFWLVMGLLIAIPVAVFFFH